MAKIYQTEDGKKHKTLNSARRTANTTVRRDKSAEIRRNKETILKYMRAGKTIAQACDDLGIARSLVSYYRRSDGLFSKDMDRLKLMADPERALEARSSMPEFPEFCEDFLDTKLFWHQLQWYDILEGRVPREIHPQQHYKQGDPGMVIVNTPPEHNLDMSTPVFVDYKGWITIGEVEVGDYVFHRNGHSYEVAEIQDFEDDDLYEVEFGTGDKILAGLDHEWQVRRSANHGLQLMTTKQLMGDLKSPNGQLKWRVFQGSPLELEERPLWDPYLMGYWIGDGSKDGYEFAVGDEDIDAFESYLNDGAYSFNKRRDSRGRSWVIGVRGIRQNLPLGQKVIKPEYFLASRAQRLELLRGLMDSDGTISAKDDRARFCQSEREDLCRDVYRLIASLGFQPRWKTYGKMNEISFKPDGEPVFRLARKASRQFTRGKNRRTEYKTIKSIQPAGRSSKTRCLTTLSDDNTYLVGDGMVETRG